MFKKNSIYFLAALLTILAACSSSDDAPVGPPTLIGAWQMTEVQTATTTYGSDNTTILTVNRCNTSNLSRQPSGRIEFGETSGTFVNVSQCAVAAGWDFDWQFDEVNNEIVFTTQDSESVLWKVKSFSNSSLTIEWEEFAGIGPNQLYREVKTNITFSRK